MITCPNCKSQLEDGTKFCIYCGSEVHIANTCPHCGNIVDAGSNFCTKCGNSLEQPSKSIEHLCPKCHSIIEKGSKFCVHCGTKIESVQNQKQFGCSNDKTNAPELTVSPPIPPTNTDSSEDEHRAKVREEYLKEKAIRNAEKAKQAASDKKARTTGVAIFIIALLVISIITYISIRNGSDNFEVSQVGNEQIDDTTGASSVEESINTKDVESEIIKELKSASDNGGEILCLKMTRDYTASNVEEEEYDEDFYTFEKGTELKRTRFTNVEKTYDGYNICMYSGACYFVPEDVVSEKTYRTANIPSSILDIATLKFCSKDDEALYLSKVKRNGYKMTDYDGTVIRGDEYCVKTNESIFLLNLSSTKEDYYGIMKGSYIEDSMIDYTGNLKGNIDVGPGRPDDCLFFVPSQESLVYGEKWYKLSEVILNE